MKLNSIKLNPGNPRKIDKIQMERLKRSISEFEKMMAIRPMVIDEGNVLLGGNMRFQALRALGYKEIPDEWVKKVADLTEAEKREFIIKDNLEFGTWKFDVLVDEWSGEDLGAWGLDVPETGKRPSKPTTKEIKPFNMVHVLISFPPDHFDEVSTILKALENVPEISIIHGSN